MKDETSLLFEIIHEDEELLALYMNDTMFRKSICYAAEVGMEVQDALIYTIKSGYEMKNKIWTGYVECKQSCMKPNQIIIEHGDVIVKNGEVTHIHVKEE